MKTLLILAAVVAAAYAQVDCQPAAPCDLDTCAANPDCSCSGTEPDIDLDERPQVRRPKI